MKNEAEMLEEARKFISEILTMSVGKEPVVIAIALGYLREALSHLPGFELQMVLGEQLGSLIASKHMESIPPEVIEQMVSGGMTEEEIKDKIRSMKN